jgi:hypothetical protein
MGAPSNLCYSVASPMFMQGLPHSPMTRNTSSMLGSVVM